jgi:hypothetical protein
MSISSNTTQSAAAAAVVTVIYPIEDGIASIASGTISQASSTAAASIGRSDPSSDSSRCMRFLNDDIGKSYIRLIDKEACARAHSAAAPSISPLSSLGEHILNLQIIQGDIALPSEEASIDIASINGCDRAIAAPIDDQRLSGICGSKIQQREHGAEKNCLPGRVEIDRVTTCHGIGIDLVQSAS